ncbi:MAG: Flp pilus assembly protein CpaB, partial [Opitutales bacterium]
WRGWDRGEDMRLDRRFWIVLVASLAWGLVVATVFYRVAGGGGGRTRAAAQKAVVVAARDLPQGVTLGREWVKLRQVPEDLFPAGGFTRVEDVLDRPVISAMQAEEPVVETRIAARGSGMGLAPLIPSGMRAIAVRVNDVVGVAGFVLPGMRVDVLVTGRPPGRADTSTRTVLQNIAVLSAGQTTQTDGKSQSINTPVVTLLVTPNDAEALTLANNEGHIQLVLRNSSDAKVTGTRGWQTLELFTGGSVEPLQPAAQKPHRAAPVPPPGPKGTPQPAAASAAPIAPPAPAPHLIEFIRGKVKTWEPVWPECASTKSCAASSGPLPEGMPSGPGWEPGTEPGPGGTPLRSGNFLAGPPAVEVK